MEQQAGAEPFATEDRANARPDDRESPPAAVHRGDVERLTEAQDELVGDLGAEHDVQAVRGSCPLMQYAAWWGVIAAAACAAVLIFAHRVLQTWCGVVSAVLVTVSIGATLGVGLPYSAGLLAPVWMVAASVAVFRARG
ncbi:hypothetical protein [Candidatus Frankia alpina]|uniref:hypothetical protein n=2 Tax=Candidatus Frankia alpina TaxID=2699483 RepID=UPI001F2B5B50|nr:hypothetical protein [Candidatus Frankia alpina]